MASQYPRETMPLFDPGNAPTIVIDGLESYLIRGDVAFSRYFVIEPVPQPIANLSPFRPLIRKICLNLVCEVKAQVAMRRQVEVAIEAREGMNCRAH